jgi:hypothetical protein
VRRVLHLYAKWLLSAATEHVFDNTEVCKVSGTIARGLVFDMHQLSNRGCVEKKSSGASGEHEKKNVLGLCFAV